MSFTPETIPSLFFYACDQHRDQVAFKTKSNEDWTSMTYADVEAQTIAIAKCLMAKGVQKKDRVAIFANNSPEWVMLDLAIQSIGAITVPIYATLNVPQSQYILVNSGAKMVFGDQPHILKDIESESLLAKVCFSNIDDNTQLTSWDAFLNRSHDISDKTFFLQMKEHQPDDVASIVYTSGTTGDPKGVMLTQKNIASNVLSSMDRIYIDHKDTSLSFLPLSHMFERTTGCYCILYRGATMAFCPNINKVAENIREIRPTVLITVPRLLEKIYQKIWAAMGQKPSILQSLFRWSLKTSPKSPLYVLFDALFFKKIREKLGGNLRFIVSGGAALSDEIYTFFDQCGLHILQGYGLTETSPVASCNPLDKRKLGTVGPALKDVEFKIDPHGEVLIKGPNIMKGYYNNEAETNKVMTEDGFFRSGDIGELDEDGYLRITDRIKDLIVTSGGKKIAPLPIENRLVASNSIDQACLVGEGRKTIGALIVPNFEAFADKDPKTIHQDEEVLQQVQKEIDRINENLSQYEKIKFFRILNEPFTLENEEVTPTLKLKRRVIHTRYADLIDAMLS